jgi:hypothetical protein
MNDAVASGQIPRVKAPEHPLHALATFELREYRRQLETAIAFSDTQNPDLQARLNDVIAEQEDRARLADHA